MSRPHAAVSYRTVLHLPGARPAFALATIGRLSYGTLFLAVLLAVQQATGSFTIAGTVLAVFGLTTLTDPVKSRLIDRYGPQRVLGLLAIVYPTALTVLAVLASSQEQRAGLYVGCAAVAGALAPPLGPTMRSLWSSLATDGELKQRAYSLDSVVEESLYAIGPIIVSLIVTIGGAAMALLVTALLAAIGTFGLATCKASRKLPVHGGVQKRRLSTGPLVAPGFGPVLIAIVGVGLALGIVDIVVPARASTEDHPEAAGYLFAAMAVGSTVGGLLWGRRRHTMPRFRQLTSLLLFMAVGVAVAGWITDLVVLGTVLLATGGLIAPAFIVSYLAAEELAPTGQRTEASSWINTVHNLGSAGGAALAGYLIDQTTLISTFTAGAAILALSVVVLLLARRSMR